LNNDLQKNAIPLRGNLYLLATKVVGDNLYRINIDEDQIKYEFYVDDNNIKIKIIIN